MVIRLLTGKNVAGSVRYNEQKVGEGQAERIGIANYPDEAVAEKSAKFRLQLLEQQARLNPAITRPAVHLAVAFHPTETMTDDQLRQLGGEVMTEAGYGRQPYLMYRHHDTPHPHIHIVTVAVDPNGRKISDQFIKRRLNTIRQKLEQRHGLMPAEVISRQRKIERVNEGIGANTNETRQPVSQFVEQTLANYSFGSVDSFRQYLAVNDIRMNTTAGRSKTGITFQLLNEAEGDGRPIRASHLPGRPTHQRLLDRFEAQTGRHQTGRDKMMTIIRQRVSQYERLTESTYKSTLHQVGIQVQEQAGAYLYVQERTGLVVEESELAPEFRRQGLLPTFAEKTEHKTNVQTPTTQAGPVAPFLERPQVVPIANPRKPSLPNERNVVPKLPQPVHSESPKPARQPTEPAGQRPVPEQPTRQSQVGPVPDEVRIGPIEKLKIPKKNRHKRGLRR